MVCFVYRDRFRTTINVMCDALATILVNHLSQKDIKDEADRVSFLNRFKLTDEVEII